MKKTIALFLVLIMCFSFCACSNSKEKQNKKKDKVSSTDYIKVDGIYVDESYTNKDNDQLKLIYLFTTVTAKEENLKTDSKSTKITINGTNTYESEHYDKTCKYMPSYYYSEYLEDIYVGSSLKIVETFLIPIGDLQSDRSLTFTNSNIPQTKNLKMKTDDIVFCKSAKAIGKAIDPKGYAKEINSRKNANDETVSKVKNAINNYYWSFYVNNTSYEIEFSYPNTFALTALGVTNSGTYSVKKGYIFCKYPNIDAPVEIPYSFENGEIKLDLVAAFDVFAG